MASGKRKTFFLYAAGADLDELTLGSLVLDYKDPLLSPKFKYTHRLLSEEERNQHAKVRDISSCVLSSKTGTAIKVNVEGANLANLSACLSGNGSIIVAGQHGKKIRLRDPEEFLNKEVLSVESAINKLSIWISAARKRFSRPHIWFLTALYQLDNARTFTSSTHEGGISPYISSDIVTALTGVPVGGSIDISRNLTVTASMIMKGSCVWAAQYQRLHIDFYWPWEDLKLPQIIPLYNTYSDGALYADDDPRTYLPPNRAFASLAAPSSTDTGDKDEEETIAKSWTESESEDIG